MLALTLPPMRNWRAFLDTASGTPTIPEPESRWTHKDDWYGGSWDEALQLAIDGWPLALEEADITVSQLREGAGLSHTITMLEPVWDVTGAEVDVGVYLSGMPECMVDVVPREVSHRGKVITFLIPAGYTHTIEHDVIVNRGLALATLCAAIIDAGHSVEIWTGNAGWLQPRKGGQRFCGVARVIEAGEPFDVGRLIFAVTHPTMLRRLWLGVWDSQPPDVAGAMKDSHYGYPPYTCEAADLPAEVTDPYVLPYLAEDDPQWEDLTTALAWSRTKFRELGLIDAES